MFAFSAGIEPNIIPTMKLILVIGIIAIFGIQLAAAKHVLKMASPNPEEGLSPEVFTMVSGANMTSIKLVLVIILEFILTILNQV